MNDLSLKRIMAIDYGEKIIGLASMAMDIDPYPTPYGRIVHNTNWLLDLKKIIENESIDIIVMGIPYFTDGTSSTLTQKMKSVLEHLRQNLDIPVFEQDETLSTFEAETRMKNDPRYNFKVNLKEIDALSACIILEEFIQNQKNKLKY